MTKEQIIEKTSGLFSTSDIRLEEVTPGIMTSVYRIVTPTSTYYFREVKNSNKSFATFKQIYTTLFEFGAKIPRIIAAENTEESSWMIVSEVKGNSFREVKNLVNLEARKEILSQTMKTISSFWKYEVEGFGYGNKQKLHNGRIVAPFSTNFEFLTDKAKEKIELLITKNYLPPEAYEISNSLEKFKPYLDSQKSFFCHGDLSDKHIMVDNDKFTGVIDLDEYRCSSYFYDVAYLYSYLTSDEQDFIAEEVKKLLPNETDIKEKILVTNFFIALDDVAYMVEDLNLEVPNHQHTESLKKNLNFLLNLRV